jgi:hypothetical protein
VAVATQLGIIKQHFRLQHLTKYMFYALIVMQGLLYEPRPVQEQLRHTRRGVQHDLGIHAQAVAAGVWEAVVFVMYAKQAVWCLDRAQ